MTVMNGLRDAGFLKIALVGLDRASAPPAALGAGSDGAVPAMTAPAAPAAPVQ